METKQADICWLVFMRMHRDVANAHKPTIAELEYDDEVVVSGLGYSGIAFFTHTLPKLAKALDRSLALATPLAISESEPVPQFLGWLWRGVYSSDGCIREDADPSCVASLRQLLYLFYKYELPYDDTTVDKAIESFVALDASLPDIIPRDPIITMATQLIARVLGGLDPMDIRPAHGPGSTASGESPAEKTRFNTVYGQLVEMYPFEEYFMWSLDHLSERLGDFLALPYKPEGAAKLVAIPKDSRGPRLISCEPLEYMWLQQGLRERIYDRVESHRWTRGHVNFRDQEPNRQLALSASRTREWATLDMKDASDRVSLALVKELFSNTRILPGLLATRTRGTRLPDGTVMPMKKFAPMGSALCFPVEAMVFWALTVATLHISCGRPLKQALKQVYVFGDDLIVPREDYAVVLQILPGYALAFNPDKCCTEGFFRESCGMDAFKGVCVTPIRIKTLWSHRRTAESLSSWVAYGNAFHKQGFTGTSGLIQRMIDRKYGNLPLVSEMEKGAMAHIRPEMAGYSANIRRVKIRFSPDNPGRPSYQRFEARVWQVRSQKESSAHYSGYEQLLRSYLSRDIDTLSFEHALPRRVYLTRGWSPLDLFH